MPNDSPDELAVLHDDRPVDAELVVRLLLLRLGRIRVGENRPPRLRRQQPEQRERDPGQREDDDQAREDAADDVAHSFSAFDLDPGSNASRTPSPISARQSTVSAITAAGKKVVQADVMIPAVCVGWSTMKK